MFALSIAAGAVAGETAVAVVGGVSEEDMGEDGTSESCSCELPPAEGSSPPGSTAVLDENENVHPSPPTFPWNVQTGRAVAGVAGSTERVVVGIGRAVVLEWTARVEMRDNSVGRLLLLPLQCYSSGNGR
jgi:hypothetical protein